MKKYTARIEDTACTIEVHPDESISVDGVEIRPAFLKLSEHRYLLRIGTRTYEILTAPDQEGDSTALMVNGRHVEVLVEDEIAVLLKQFRSDRSANSGAAVVKAPMPGRIAKILVEPGMTIEAGQGGVILEAMKMENEIKSPSAGTIRTVRVNEADTVEKNAVLVEIQ